MRKGKALNNFFLFLVILVFLGYYLPIKQLVVSIGYTMLTLVLPLLGVFYLEKLSKKQYIALFAMSYGLILIILSKLQKSPNSTAILGLFSIIAGLAYFMSLQKNPNEVNDISKYN